MIARFVSPLKPNKMGNKARKPSDLNDHELYWQIYENDEVVANCDHLFKYLKIN
jgi:hypothetical protein